MNASPSFEPPPQQQRTAPQAAPSDAPRRKSRSKSNLAYAHRRQALEVAIKLATYSTMSIFGIVALGHSIRYCWEQHSKFQPLKIELKDARLRTERSTHDLSRAIDPKSERNLAQANTYKILADRRRITIVSAKPTTTATSSKPPVRD
jgi:hypothetical protein